MGVNYGFLNIGSYKFKADDHGKKVFNAFIDGNSTGTGKIVASIAGSTRTFYSNPINIVSSSDFIQWGDFNVSTMFGYGRQDSNFIIDYAKNVSQLDFIGLDDDITLLNDHSDCQYEWDG